jgi:hypothetical protein
MRRLGLAGCLFLFAAAPAGVAAGQGRERALEQIPELMGRILDSQEEIRAREAEAEPVVRGHEAQLAAARRGIESATSEHQVASALVDYVEAYAARLEAQEAGLRSIESAVVRMRADARELVRASDAAGRTPPASADERRLFLEDHYQGLAAATGALAERLHREDEAATTGAVLHASWASQGALDLPLPQLGPEGALAFARKAEGLYARYQARANQLRAERRAVRRLLDLLIERQLAHRLDALFAGSETLGLGALLASGGRSAEWQDLGSVVGRAVGLPAEAGDGLRPDAGSLDRLDHFARGGHRDEAR